MRYILSFLLVLGCVPISQAWAISRENCSSAITMYCTMCHCTARICKGLEKFDGQGWTAVLKRMGEESDDVDEGVQNMVHGCLTAIRPGDALVCGKGRE